MGLVSFRSSLHLRDMCSNHVFTSSRPAAIALSNPRRFLTDTQCRWEKYPFSLIPHMRRRFGSSCNIGPKCVWKKGVHRKRNIQTLTSRKENSSRFYSLGLQRVAALKVRFIAFFLPPLIGGDGGFRGSRLVDTFLSVVSWQTGYALIGVSWTPQNLATWFLI